MRIRIPLLLLRIQGNLYGSIARTTMSERGVNMLNEKEVKELVDCIIEELECRDCRTEDPFIDYQRGGLESITYKLNKFYDIKSK